MRTKRKWMHIDRADEIAVARKAAGAARPSSSLGLVGVPASGTPTACASFGAGRARDAGLLGFVREVANVTAVFPERHALVMMASFILPSDAVRVADEEASDLVLDAKINHLAGGLMPQVAHAPLSPPAHFVLGPLQLLKVSGALLAARLLFGDLSELPTSLPLQRADAAPGHDQRFAGVRGHGSQVDFPEIDRCLHRAGSPFRLGNLDADVQLEAPVPDQCAGPGVFRQIERQDEGRATLAHRQEKAPFLFADGLGGPVDGVEPFLAPRILHVHFRVFFAKFAGGCNSGNKHSYDRLDRLAMQHKAASYQLTEGVFVRPFEVVESRLLVGLHTCVPHTGRFHLCRFEPLEERRRQVGQSIHTNYFHILLFFLSARKAGICRVAA